MDSSTKNSGTVTPVKNPQVNRSKISKIPKDYENLNPNLRSPGSKSSKSPAIKSAVKSQKSAAKNSNPVSSPKNKIRERKFVVAKRNPKKEKENSSKLACNCKDKVGQKCLCLAYESLRASQEEFFKNRAGNGSKEENVGNTVGYETKSKETDGFKMNGPIESNPDENKKLGEMGSLHNKRRRDILLEEREIMLEPRSGKVMSLVKAFERLLTTPPNSDQNDGKDSEDNDKKGVEWELPARPTKAPETQVSSSSFCPSDFFISSDSLGLDSLVSSSLDSNHGSFTFSSKGSEGGHRSRRNSTESSRIFKVRRWKKRQQLKATRQQPFKLLTEQRGRNKEEEFTKKVQEMMIEEEKQRIPIAQGLPWTTDEPECLVKPFVKESTRPVDLVLHSDVRAMDRAEFDQQVAQKMIFIEQFRMERERQQKLGEEEEVRRLRKELIPKAQPMPYFDRPFIPRRKHHVEDLK